MASRPAPRIVVDTNIMVPALVALAARPRHDTAGAALLWYWRKRYCTFVVSAPLLQEYEDVLQRPAFGMRPAEASQVCTRIAHAAPVVSVPSSKPLRTVDPGDDMVLKTAIAGRAELLLTNNGRHFAEVATLPGGTVDLQYRGVRVVGLTDAMRAIHMTHPASRSAYQRRPQGLSAILG